MKITIDFSNLSEFQLGPYLWLLRRIDGLEDYGECHADLSEVHLRRGLDGTPLIDTTYHEVVHAISDAYGLDLTEHQVQTLGMGLAQFSTTQR